MDGQVTKNVVLQSKEYQIIQDVVKVRSLGGKGFSAALRAIVREWAELTNFPITDTEVEVIQDVEQADS